MKPLLSRLIKGNEKLRRERDRTSDESFGVLLEHLPDAIVFLNPHDEKVSWPIVYCNSAFCEMNGYSRQALIGQSIDIVHALPEDPDELQAHFDERAAYLERLRRGGTLRTEVEHLDKSGKTVFIAVSSRLVEVNGMQLVMGVDRDITAFKQMEEALRESEEKYRSLFDDVPLGLFESTPTGEHLNVNLGYVEMLGYPDRETLLATQAQDLYVDVMERKRWQDEIDELDMLPSTVNRLRCYDGRVIWVRASTRVIRDEDGQIVSYRGSLEDITEQKQAEEQIRAHTADLKAANERLEAQVKLRKRWEKLLEFQATELARSNRELQQFAYAASHDLQEPLRMVTSYLQLLERRYKGQLDTDADEFIAFAVDGASRMKRLIEDLLSFSRVGTRGKDFEPTDGEAVLEQTLRNLEMAISESEAAVTHDPLPTVMADGGQLVQLLQNLIGNAIKFRSDEPPTVHVGAERQDGKWVFSVRDNGIGIDPRYSERIFEIFQRLHTRDKYPGTGIGLAVCKKIVERHGGRIWAESQPGEGATFYFTLPATTERTEHEHATR